MELIPGSILQYFLTDWVREGIWCLSYEFYPLKELFPEQGIYGGKSFYMSKEEKRKGKRNTFI